MTNRSKRISDHIAAAIIRNTKKKWAGLHSDALSTIEKELIENEHSNNRNTERRKHDASGDTNQ
jgi:hypothetical protein